jgi:hypothetical protein
VHHYLIIALLKNCTTATGAVGLVHGVRARCRRGGDNAAFLFLGVHDAAQKKNVTISSFFVTVAVIFHALTEVKKKYYLQLQTSRT